MPKHTVVYKNSWKRTDDCASVHLLHCGAKHYRSLGKEQQRHYTSLEVVREYHYRNTTLYPVMHSVIH